MSEENSENNPDAKTDLDSNLPPQTTNDVVESRSLQERVQELSTVSVLPPIQLTQEVLTFSDIEAQRAISSKKAFQLAKPMTVNILSPTYVTYVEIEGHKNFNANIQLRFRNQKGTEQFAKLQKISAREYRVPVNDFAVKIEFLPIDGIFIRAKVSISDIRIFGYPGPATQDWLTAIAIFSEDVTYCRSVLDQEFKSLKNTRSQIDSDLDALNSERTDHESKLQALRAGIRETQDELSKIENIKSKTEIETNDSQSSLADLQSRLEKAQENLDQSKSLLSEVNREHEDRIATVQQLTKDIAQKRAELDALNRDQSVFAVDLKGYGQRGVNQSKVYVLLLILVIFGVSQVAILAFDELDTIWRAIVEDPVRISWSLVAITRFGMIMIFTASIGALTSLGYAFIKRLIQIQERSLDLSAVSILARDVTDATITDPGVDDAQRMAVFHAARMALVRNLLAGMFERLADSKKEDRDQEIQKFNAIDMATVTKFLMKIAKQ